MKKLILMLAIILSGNILHAQFISFKASTGDTEMDRILTNVDVQARADINLFKNDITTSFNIVRSKIDQAIKILSPGDLFMAAQLSVSLNKPFETVVETYNKNKSRGWGAIAKDMGIKPGSPEFHAMKKSMKSKGSKSKDSGAEGKSKDKGGKGKGNKK
jgi:hypothetical protein